MNKLIVVLVALLLVAEAHRSHKKGNSHSGKSDKDSNKVEVGQPTSCAIYIELPVPLVEDDSSSSSSSSSSGNSGVTFYDPGQFISQGGLYQTADTTYYFSFCVDSPQPDAIEFCSSESAVCAVKAEVGTSMGSFADMTFAPKDNYEAGVVLSYATADATCPNGTNTYSFVLNCSKHYDPETNYTVTNMVQDACGTIFYINTVAACPITSELVEVPVQTKKGSVFTRFLILGFSVLGGVICICSCCLAFCLACKNRREKCAKQGGNRSWCQKKRQATAPAPVAQRPAPVAAPRPPVTPPPAQAIAPQMPQMPGYFVPVPQGMAPMYPNLYQGGYLPLVPMMPQQQAVQQQHQPAHNPFVQLEENHLQQREKQITEDERLAKLLQQQFNHESA